MGYHSAIKAIERIAIVICAAEVLRQLGLYFAGDIMEAVQTRLGTSDRMVMFWMEHIPRSIVWFFLNLMVAGWVFVDAPRHRVSRPVWVALALTSGVLGLSVYLLRVLIAKYESGQQPAPTCRECGYNLTGNTSGICPECGTSVSEDVKKRPATEEPEPAG